MTSKTASEGIPLTIIGGYLGAGKTTLLNHILHHSEGRRLAVIVNDFGKINIDAELIESRDEEVINLANGCICCTLVDGFAATLLRISNLASPPDHVIVEASGVADPYRLGLQANMPGFRPDGVIVLADAELVRQKARDKYVGETVVRQLQGADLIVLNKTDLVDGETRWEVRAWLQDIVPDVRIVEAVHGAVPLPLLFGVPRIGGPESNLRLPAASLHVDYETWSYAGEQPLDGNAFRALVAMLPEGVIRAKGVLCLREKPEQRIIFQLVGKRWSLEAGSDWGSTQPISQLVMIALPGSINANRLEQTLISCSEIRKQHKGKQ